MPKVDGSAFKKARRLLQFKDHSDDPRYYGYGSQEWLAAEANLSLRTVQSLEAGTASLRTVDAVSVILGIEGRRFFLDHGAKSIDFNAPGIVDFRPGLHSSLCVSLSPISIKINNDSIDYVVLKKISLELLVDDVSISLTDAFEVEEEYFSSTNFDDNSPMTYVLISAHKPYVESVLFKQKDFQKDIIGIYYWGEFVDLLRYADDSKILLKVSLDFENFSINKEIIVSINESLNFFSDLEYYEYPGFFQPKALMI